MLASHVAVPEPYEQKTIELISTSSRPNVQRSKRPLGYHGDGVGVLVVGRLNNGAAGNAELGDWMIASAASAARQRSQLLLRLKKATERTRTSLSVSSSGTDLSIWTYFGAAPVAEAGVAAVYAEALAASGALVGAGSRGGMLWHRKRQIVGLKQQSKSLIRRPETTSMRDTKRG